MEQEAEYGAQEKKNGINSFILQIWNLFEICFVRVLLFRWASEECV